MPVIIKNAIFVNYPFYDEKIYAHIYVLHIARLDCNDNLQEPLHTTKTCIIGNRSIH